MSTNTISLNENRIIELIQEKKESGMQLLFDSFYDELYQYCFRLIRNKEDSEDILQCIFIDLWENASRRTIKRLKPYLFQMLKFQVYNYWSSQKEITRLADEFNEILISEELNPTLESIELEHAVSLAVNNLPPVCKKIFEMSRFEELSHDEIAIRLNISKQTVKNQLSKAVKILKANPYVNSVLTNLSFWLFLNPF